MKHRIEEIEEAYEAALDKLVDLVNQTNPGPTDDATAKAARVVSAFASVKYNEATGRPHINRHGE